MNLVVQTYTKFRPCLVFLFQDILDEMRKELSKLKEELIDGNSLTSAVLQKDQQSHQISHNHASTTFLYLFLPLFSFLPLGIV